VLGLFCNIKMRYETVLIINLFIKKSSVYLFVVGKAKKTSHSQ
jgi:hypothetical protein